MMQKVDIRWHLLDEAAALLVSNAPAKGDYWGVELRAKYATTKASDVVEQYHRTVRGLAWSYWSRLPKAQRERLKCGGCGATGCKMWREYNTFANYTKVLCGPCALADQGKEGPIDANGKVGHELGKCDQIGWLVPAVPDLEGAGFWGYTSVPAEAVKWWKDLPSYPKDAP